MALRNVLEHLGSTETNFINKSNEYGQDALKLDEAEQKRKLESLSTFSTKLSEHLIREKKKENERLEKEGEIDAIEEEIEKQEKEGDPGISQEVIDAYNKGVEQLKENKTAFDGAALDVLDQGGSFEESRQVKEMSGWRLYGYTKQKAIMAGESYKAWMEGEMANNNDIKITFQGEEFTPAEAAAGGSMDQKRVAMTALRRKYLDERGLLGVNRVLLADHFYDKAITAHSQIMADYQKDDAIQKSFKTEEDARREFSADWDFGAYISTMAPTKDENNKTRHRKGVLDKIFEVMKQEADISRLTPQVLKKIEDQIITITVNGKKKQVRVGTHWRGRFLKFREELAAERRSNWDADKADRKMRAEQIEEDGIKWILENIDTATPQDFAHIRKKVAELGYKTERLDTIESRLGSTALANKDLEAKFTSLFEMNMLTPEMVSNAPAKIQAKWMPRAIEQDTLRKANKGYTKELQSLEEEVKLISVGPDKDLGVVPQLIAKELQQMFLKKAWEYKQLGVENPVARALLETKQHFLDEGGDRQNDKGRYYNSSTLGTVGEFKNFENAIFGNNKDLNSSIIQRDIGINQAIAEQGLQKVLSKPDIMFTKSEAESWEDGYGKPGWEIPSRVKLYSRKYGIPEFEIINKQRNAHELSELKPPDHYRYLIEKVNPELRSLLSRNSYSPNQSVRVLSSTNTYEPEIVPNGLGETVEKAATSNNVDPGLVAGVVETSPNKWNTSEAYIELVAMTLGEMNQYFQGDTDGLLLAFNPFSNLGDIYKSGSKYGLQDVWSNPATWRSSIRGN